MSTISSSTSDSVSEVDPLFNCVIDSPSKPLPQASRASSYEFPEAVSAFPLPPRRPIQADLVTHHQALEGITTSHLSTNQPVSLYGVAIGGGNSKRAGTGLAGRAMVKTPSYTTHQARIKISRSLNHSQHQHINTLYNNPQPTPNQSSRRPEPEKGVRTRYPIRVLPRDSPIPTANPSHRASSFELPTVSGRTHSEFIRPSLKQANRTNKNSGANSLDVSHRPFNTFEPTISPLSNTYPYHTTPEDVESLSACKGTCKDIPSHMNSRHTGDVLIGPGRRTIPHDEGRHGRDLRSSNAQPMSARGLDHASASMDMARVSIPEPRSLVNLNTSSVPDLRSEAISRMTTPSQLDPAKQTRWQAFFSSTSSPKRKTNVTRPHISAPLVESFVVTESGALYTSLETSPRRPAPSRGSIESVPLKTQSSLFHDRLADGLAIRPSLPSSIGQKPSPPEAGKKSTRGRPRSRSFSGFLKGPDVAQTFLRPQDQFTMNFSTNLVISQSSTSLPNSPVALNAIPLPFTGSGPRDSYELSQYNRSTSTPCIEPIPPQPPKAPIVITPQTPVFSETKEDNEPSHACVGQKNSQNPPSKLLLHANTQIASRKRSRIRFRQTLEHIPDPSLLNLPPSPCLQTRITIRSAPLAPCLRHTKISEEKQLGSPHHHSINLHPHGNQPSSHSGMSLKNTAARGMRILRRCKRNPPRDKPDPSMATLEVDSRAEPSSSRSEQGPPQNTDHLAVRTLAPKLNLTFVDLDHHIGSRFSVNTLLKEVQKALPDPMPSSKPIGSGGCGTTLKPAANATSYHQNQSCPQTNVVLNPLPIKPTVEISRDVTDPTLSHRISRKNANMVFDRESVASLQGTPGLLSVSDGCATGFSSRLTSQHSRSVEVITAEGNELMFQMVEPPSENISRPRPSIESLEHVRRMVLQTPRHFLDPRLSGDDDYLLSLKDSIMSQSVSDVREAKEFKQLSERLVRLHTSVRDCLENSPDEKPRTPRVPTHQKLKRVQTWLSSVPSSTTLSTIHPPLDWHHDRSERSCELNCQLLGNVYLEGLESEGNRWIGDSPESPIDRHHMPICLARSGSKSKARLVIRNQTSNDPTGSVIDSSSNTETGELLEGFQTNPSLLGSSGQVCETRESLLPFNSNSSSSKQASNDEKYSISSLNRISLHDRHQVEEVKGIVRIRAPSDSSMSENMLNGMNFRLPDRLVSIFESPRPAPVPAIQDDDDKKMKKMKIKKRSRLILSPLASTILP